MVDTKQAWTIISRVLAGSAVVIWFVHIYFWFSWFNAGSERIDILSGRIVPLQNHSAVRYITSQQYRDITAMQISAGVLFVVGLLIQELIIRPRKSKPWGRKQF